MARRNLRFALTAVFGPPVFFLVWLLAPAGPAEAQWSLEGEGNLFYTDDVALFSASRRLALREDPTQPVVDRTGQGSDMVVEPMAELKRAFSFPAGNTELAFRAQGFVFAQHPIFNHGTYRFGLTQKFSSDSLVRVAYFYAPNLFLGNNFSPRFGNGVIAEERVSTQLWNVQLERRITESLNLRLLGRYGTRSYTEAFAERNTRLWTIGPHVEWAMPPRVNLILGYHYERGLADGRNQPQYDDDVSYINHYAAAGLMVQLSEKISVELGLDYERNDFTSDLAGDERRGAHEDVYQGEIELRRRLNNVAAVTLGFQRTQRNSTFGSTRVVTDNNVWLGGEFRF